MLDLVRRWAATFRRISSPTPTPHALTTGVMVMAAATHYPAPALLLLLLLELMSISSAFIFIPSPVLLVAVPRTLGRMPRHATSVPSYRVTRHAPTRSDEATLTISLADGRTFVLQDACPPTNHSLLHAEVDPAILSVQDAVFGTRFDLRTGRLRGAWCPDSWWARRLFKPADLVPVSSSAAVTAVAGKEQTP